MAKPSMFSRDYERQMRQRRINILLIILIIVVGGYFGTKYYLEKNDIKLGWVEKIKNILPKKVEKVDNNEKNPDNNKPDNNNPTKDNDNISNTPKEEVKTSYAEYTLKDGSIVKIEFTEKAGQIDITGFKDNLNSSFDISQDKKFIVFEDKGAGSIILGNIKGEFKNVEMQSYTVKSSGKTYSREKMIVALPKIVWSAKPHFTSDGRVVYFTCLPYIRENIDLSLWIVDGTGQQKMAAYKVGTKDPSNISYEGFDESGNLKININGTLYILNKDTNKLSK